MPVKVSSRPRWKVIAASVGAFVSAAVTLYTDLFGADIGGEADKFVKTLVIVVTTFAAGYMKRDGIPGEGA